MKFNWLVVAEAGAVDGRGATTLIGVSQNVITTHTLPVDVKRMVCAYATDENDDLAPGDTLQVHLEVRRPDGEIITAVTNDAKIGQKRWPKIPGSVQIAVEVGFAAHAYGAYTITCELANDAIGKMGDSVTLYVLDEVDRSVDQDESRE